MSESGKSSVFGDSDEEDTADGRYDIQTDSPAEMHQEPPTPATADLASDEQFDVFQPRMDDFSQDEKNWFEEIKTFEAMDEGDSGPAGDSSCKGDDFKFREDLRDVGRQVSVPYPALSPNQPSTDAFGRIHFDGENSSRDHPAWYVRLAYNTPQDVLQKLLESKYEILKSTSRALRIHCIDRSSWPKDVEMPTYNPQDPAWKFDKEIIIKKIRKDLCYICRKTAGLVLTWSGSGEDNLVHHVLRKIVEDTRHSKEPLNNLATIATPPWKSVDNHVKEKLRVKGEGVHLRAERDTSSLRDSCDGGQDQVSSHRATLGTNVSQYASHFLLLDDSVAVDDPAFLSHFRGFHKSMISTMEAYEKTKPRQMPVVCILFNGHHDALKMVRHALLKKIPVLVVQGSGGYADVIADVYMHARQLSVKERDGNGDVRTRIKKRPGKRGKHYMEKEATKHHYLKEIFEYLDYLTVYVPAISVQTLDSVIFEALLKHNQQTKISGLMEMMQHSKKSFPRSLSVTEKHSFLDSPEAQMDIFIEALKQNCVDVVKAFLDTMHIDDKFMEHLHMGRILRLYTENPGQNERLIDFRRKLMQLLTKLTLFPLRCIGDGCSSCDVDTHTGSAEMELQGQRSCLHPIQELFLWSLHARQVDMAVIFWERCQDKIAAALMAEKVFHRQAKQIKDLDIKWQMQENARRFQRLAIQTLKNCQMMNEAGTELLLTKPCPWWGNISVLQLGIMTGNKEFMAQTACKNIMTRIWKGKPPSESEKKMRQRPLQLVDVKKDRGYCDRWCNCPPVCKYAANFVVQVLFLGLFTYGLLSDLGRGITPIFIALIVWVAAIALEEIRQVLSRDPVISDLITSTRDNRPLRTQVQTYLSQGWNWLDLITIIFFMCGMMVFAPCSTVHELGRFLLSIDIFCFFLRMFQMLMVFEELGLMLVMVYKMMKDTKNFMIILLIFVLAYAVASESLLYPESELGWQRLYHLPRKAYWQVFGELFLDEIEIRDATGELSCSEGNTSKHFGYGEPHCPTYSGSFIVPILLGVHVMITHVLLLNLLIARFGVTFTKVHDDACEYQSWHRCQIITEYYSRTALPPPFNLFHVVWTFLGACCAAVRRCCHRCCSKPRRRGQNRDRTNDLPLTPPGTAANSHENANLIHKVWMRRSADEQWVDVFWENTLPPRVQQGTNTEFYTVTLKEVSSQAHTPSAPEVFKVTRKKGCDPAKEQALAIWNLKPTHTYSVDVEGMEAKSDPVTASRPQGDLNNTQKFEDEQAQWVCRQEEIKDQLTQLQEQGEGTREELLRVAEDHRQASDALKQDINKISTELDLSAKKLGNVEQNSEESKTTVTKLYRFMKKNYEAMQQEVDKHKLATFEAESERTEMKKKKENAEEEKKTVENNLADMKMKRDEAEQKRKTAERELEEMKKLKEEAEKEKTEAETELEKVRGEVEGLRSERQIAVTQGQRNVEQQLQNIQEQLQQLQALQQQ